MKTLILKRKINQSIIVGEDVTIKIKDVVVSDNTTVVQLEIDAPEYICVDREEVRVKRLERIKKATSLGYSSKEKKH